jgi:hypothetical protein
MSAQEALKYGLIDEIVQPNDEKLRALSLPPPGMAPQLFGELPEGAEDYQFGKIVSSCLLTLCVKLLAVSLVRVCVLCVGVDCAEVWNWRPCCGF